MSGRKPVISRRTIGADDVSNVEQGGGYVVVNSDYTGETINVSQTDDLSFHFQWRSSTLTATLFVQARNGTSGQDDWRNLDFGSSITISGASGEHEILLSEMPFTNVRLFIDVASGSGQVGATFTSKSFGN